MDIGYILRRAWQITWDQKLLWVFGFLTSLGVAGSRISISGSQWELVVQELSPEVQTHVAAFLNDPNFATWTTVLTLLSLFANVGTMMLGALGRVGLVHQTRAAEDYGVVVLRGGWLAARRHFWQVFFIHLLLGLPLGALILAGLLPGIGSRLFFANQARSGNTFLGDVTASFLSLACFVPAGCVALVIANPILVWRRLSIRACVLEKLGVQASIGRGWGMLREYLKEIVLVWFVLLCIRALVLFLAALPVVLVGLSLWTVAQLTWSAAPLLSLALTLVVGVVTWLLTVVVIGVAETLSSVTWTLMYRDLTGLGRTGEPLEALG